MRSVSPTSQTFQNDQQVEQLLQYWDSPFTALYNDKASLGMRLDVREPKNNGTWTLPAIITGGNDASLTTAFTTTGNPPPADTYSAACIADGRTSNVIGYWAAGAPGYHGVTKYRRVAYRFRGTLKSAVDRGWFMPLSDPLSLQFGVAGSGYVRLRKNDVTFYQGKITEELFCTDGMTWIAPQVFASATDILDIFYLQNDDPWGGFVVKVRDITDATNYVLGDMTTQYRTSLQKRWSTQEAPVVGCGLFDTGVATAQTIPMAMSISTEIRTGQSPKLTFTLPLISTVNDEVGWEFVVDNTDPLGFLRGTVVAGGSQMTLRRNRLVRCKLGFKNWTGGTSELWPTFTGFIEDFDEASSGMVRVTASGFEQRLAEQFVKNYPDPVSYMANGFRRKSGTIEPVYAVMAYDNWPMELAIRDMLVRCGVDEARMAAPLKAPQATPPDVPVQI